MARPRSPSCFEFDCEFDRAGERLGTYAHLKTTEDMADSRYQRMQRPLRARRHARRRSRQLHPAGNPRAAR